MKKMTTVETTAMTIPISGYVPMTDGLLNSYEYMSGLIETDMDVRNKFFGSVALHELREKVIHDKIVESVNLYKELNDFLENQNSEKTAENYRHWINVFLKYCESKKVDPLRINRKNVEKYLNYLKKIYSSGSVRVMIMGVSSFYQHLMIHHEKLFIQNYFLKLKLPNNTPTRRIDKVEENDIEVLRNKLLEDGKDYLVCLIDICSKHGLRVGIFKEMKIDRNGNWQSISKGSGRSGKFTQEEVDQINNSKICLKTVSTLKNTFRQYTIRLYNEGLISCPYSVHDLRHFNITEKLKPMKIPEFLEYSKGIHKDPKTTLGYYNR